MERRIGRPHAVFLGLFTLVTLALFALGVFSVAAREGWAGDVVSLESALPSAQGLRVGTRVRVLGIPVGQITGIEPPARPGEPVIVHFWIRGESRDLVRADATARILKDGLVGERVLEIEPGSADAAPIAPGAQLASLAPPDFEDLLAKVDSLVDGISSGKGTVGKLVTDEEAYRDVQESVHRLNDLLSTLDENYRSVKGNWFVKRYVNDRYQLLVRPEATTHRMIFREKDLFEPGRAILTEAGKERIAEAATWIRGFDEQNAEVLIAGFATDESDGRLAELTTVKQAEAVRSQLVDTHTVHRTGWVSRRTVSAHGFGNLPNPDESSEPAPHRIEILVFVTE